MRRELRDRPARGPAPHLSPPSPAFPARLLAAGAAVPLLLAVEIAGQPGVPPSDTRVNRPDTSNRVVKSFDFEEALAQAHPLPQFWFRAQGTDAAPRPGYPGWNRAVLDFGPAHSGKVSLMLPTKGGSTSARLEPGVIPVFPDTDYVVSAQVRTSGLRNARATIVARFLNSANEPITGSEVRGPLVIGDGWREASVALPGRAPGAAFIQIDLELLQPEQFEPPRLPASHQVWPQDISGACWFDDVTVVQLPRVSLTTGVASNVILGPEKPALTVQVRDLTGEALTAHLIVQDLDARTLDTLERRVDSGQLRWGWTPALTKFGWYRATLELRRGGTRVGATHTDFLWLPPLEAEGRGGADRGRFGLLLDDLPAQHRRALPELAGRSGAGAVTVPVWRAGLTAAGAGAEALALSEAVDPLLADGVRVTGSLPIIPDELAAAGKVGRGDLWQILDRERGVWSPYLFPFLDKYGQRMPRWRVGRLDDASADAPADLAGPAGRLERAIGKIVPGPVIETPWTTDAAFAEGAENRDSARSAGGTGAALVATLPYWTDETSLPTLAEAWTRSSTESGAGSDLTLVLDTLPRPPFDGRAAAAHLMRRALWAWRSFEASDAPGGGALLALRQPWEWSDEARSQVMPRPELGVWRTLSDELSGRRVVGELAASPGVRCLILAPAPGAPAGRAGALVAWRESADPGSAVLDLYMGEGDVRAVDLFGNTTPVRFTADVAAKGRAKSGTHTVRVEDTPVFVEGVDVDLARFIASFRLEPAFASAVIAEHEHALVFVNTWTAAIEGKFAIVEPGGMSGDGGKRDRTWTITPRVAAFAVPPGETLRVPISVSFGASEEAGVRTFVVDVELTGGAPPARLRLRAPLDIRLENIQVDAIARSAPTPAGPDVVVEAVVTNRGQTPVTLQLAAFAPGESRKRAMVNDLPPNNSKTVRFSFAGAAKRLKGQSVIVRVEDTETDSGVNRSVKVE